jgi:virginiamycin B lyase
MAVLLIGVLSAGRADAAIYWGAFDGIARANLDGTARNDKFVVPDGTVCGIDVDSQHIYWADSYRDKISRASLDGTNVEEIFIAPEGGLPCDLAVDSQFIYWPNMSGDTIGRARLDGSDVETDFIAAPEHPCGVAVNRTTIYWSSDQEGVIRAADINGANGSEVVVTGLSTPCGIALDQAHIYWADGDSGAIGRANLDGSEALPNFIDGGEFTSTVAINGGQLYWVNAGWGFQSIGRADLDGANVNQRFLAGLRYPFALAVDSVHVDPVAVAPATPGTFQIGKLKHNRHSGAAFLAIDIFGFGDLHATAPGAKARVLPVEVPTGVNPLRRWLKISARSGRRGASGCIHNALGRYGMARIGLSISFVEPGHEPVVKSKIVTLLKSGGRLSRTRRAASRRVVNCGAVSTLRSLD